jgi:hypothetical protein
VRDGCSPGFKTTGAAIMSDSYIIEVSSRAAGIVVRDKAGFRFFAAAPQFFRLEGQLFRSARDAERAAAQFADERDVKPA